MNSRPEGVRAHWETYPPQGGPFSRRLFVIEQVHGDGLVSTVVASKSDAKSIIAAYLAEDKPAATYDHKHTADSFVDPLRAR